jgi:hypothetical protein
MARRLGTLLVLAAAVILSAVSSASDLRRAPVTAPAAARLAGSSGGFDFCLRDANGSVFRFNSSTGAYVACGADGTYEQGFGVVTRDGDNIALSHRFTSGFLTGFESARATVNETTGHGTAALNALREGFSPYARVSIDDPNVGTGDCVACLSRSAVNEGFVNSFVVPSNSIGLGNGVTDATILQSYSLNANFGGRLNRLVAGVGRNGAGSLSFQFTVFSDDHGQPGTEIYLGPTIHYDDFPALPTLGVVRQSLKIDPGAKFWAGIRWNPSTDPLYLAFGTNADAPLSPVYLCEPGHGCNSVTSSSVFSQLRSLYLSADVEYPTEYATGGFARYGDGESTDIISSKCDGSYRQIDVGLLKPLVELYAEGNPEASINPSSYSDAFARITPVASDTGTGLDGFAKTRFGTTGFSAFSFATSSQLKFCTRPEDATDYACHSVTGYVPGTCGYTRIVGVTGGYEISCADAPADWIDRWFLQYDGTGWTSQPLNAVKSTPSIGSPEFGFPWYAASGSKLGVAYEYKTTAGRIEAQLVKGDSVIGTYTVDTDDPPAGFNPSLATRMAGDCTRRGLCVFGRYDSHTQSNVADMVDFRESPPEIKSWVLGPAPSGFGFGRAVNLGGRNGTALYASYATSPIANQYRLQLDSIDLKAYAKNTLSYDFGTGSGRYPLALSRERGEWGLGTREGIGALYSLTAGCAPARVGGRSSSGSSGGGVVFPCENAPAVGRRF